MEYGLKVTSHAFEKPSAASHDNITFAGGWAVYIYTVCGIWQPWQVVSDKILFLRQKKVS